MVLDLVDKEGTKSGKGLGWSWFGLNDGKRDAKILRELGEIYKKGAIDVDVFEQKIKGLTSTSRANARAIRDNNVEGADLSKGFLEAAASADKMTISSKLLAGGMKTLKLAGSMVLTLIVTEALSIPFRIAEANKEAVAAANEGAKALNEESKSIDGYKEKISELQTALQSGNLTQGEAYNKRKELISIQDELIGKYGTEKDVVDKVTAAIKGNVNVLDEFNEKSWNSWYTKSNSSKGLFQIKSPLDEAKKYMEGYNEDGDNSNNNKKIFQ